MKPRHIAYFIWTVIAVLAVICWLVPENGFYIGHWALRWPTLAHVLEIQDAEDGDFFDIDTTWVDDIEVMLDSIDNDGTFTHTTSQESSIQPLEPNYQRVDSAQRAMGYTAQPSTELEVSKHIAHSNPNTNDSRKYLAAFYQALDSSQNIPIRVVHYGDSQIEEDRITNKLRERWQKRYGGGGVGLIPLHQTIPTRSIRQWISMNGVRQNAKAGPKRYLIYGPRSMRQDNNDYGVMGQVAVMDSSLVAGSEHIEMHIEPIDRKNHPHKYFNQVRLLGDGIYGEIILQDGTIYPSLCNNQTLFYLPDSTTQCEIHLDGVGKVYGISLETPRGVLVDNIPMRGCSGTFFTRMDSQPLQDYFYHTNTRLVILQFGGNMIPQSSTKSIINGYVKNLRQQVRHLRACAPQASILFVGPSDMSTRINGQMDTYPMLPYLDSQLKKMSQEEQIAYWSIYDAMGGRGSMITWVENGLAGSDYVHFTRTGASKIGEMLGKWIDEGINL